MLVGTLPTALKPMVSSRVGRMQTSRFCSPTRNLNSLLGGGSERFKSGLTSLTPMKYYVLLLLTLALLSASKPLHAQGTAFTYQGRLNVNSAPANGSYDLSFTLFNASTSGTALAGPVTNTAVTVSNGLFTTTINFGSVFTGGSNWLELAVSSNNANAFNKLTPRQQLTPVPYADFATTSSNLLGSISQSQLPAGILLNGASGVTLTGTFSGTGTGLTVTTPTSANFVFAYDTTTQTLPLNSFASITFNNNAQLSGWSHSISSANFTCAQSGIYLVEYHVQPAANPTSAGDLMTVRATLNGVEIAGSAAALTAYPGDTEPEISKTFIASISAGGTLSFQISDSTTSGGSIAPAGTATTKTSAACAIVRIQ